MTPQTKKQLREEINKLDYSFCDFSAEYDNEQICKWCDETKGNFRHTAIAAIEALFTAHLQAIRKSIEADMPNPPFVSFEQCRTVIDYSERQAIREVVKQCKAALTKGFEV